MSVCRDAYLTPRERELEDLAAEGRDARWTGSAGWAVVVVVALIVGFVAWTRLLAQTASEVVTLDMSEPAVIGGGRSGMGAVRVPGSLNVQLRAVAVMGLWISGLGVLGTLGRLARGRALTFRDGLGALLAFGAVAVWLLLGVLGQAGSCTAMSCWVWLGAVGLVAVRTVGTVRPWQR